MTRRFTEDPTGDPASGYCMIVVPNDNADLPFVTRRIEIAAAGTLSVITEHGDVVNFPSFPAGKSFDLRAARIRATGTSVVAGSIIAYF